VAAHDLPHLRWQVLDQRAQWLRRAGDLEAARVAYEEALGAIELLRGTVHDEKWLLSFMSGRRKIHEGLVDVLLETGSLDAAYALTESARARTLIEGLSLTNGGSSEVSVHDVSRPPRAAAASLGRIVTFEIIGSEIISYVVVDGDVTVTRELSTVERIETLLIRLEAQWRRFDDIGLVARQRRNLVPPTVDLLQQLYLELLARSPAAVEGDSLLVVPAGLLANVPFGALHDGTCHLVERLAVTTAPSVTAARALHGTRRGRRRLVLGVEDVPFAREGPCRSER
jgi:hypothetical protein